MQVLFSVHPGNPTGTVLSLPWLGGRWNWPSATILCRSRRVLRRPGAAGFATLDQPAARRLGAWQHAFRRCLVFHSLSKRSSRAGLAFGSGGWRPGSDQRVPALSHLPRLRHARAVPTGQYRGLERYAACAHQPPAVPQKFDQVLPILREVLPVVRPDGGFLSLARRRRRRQPLCLRAVQRPLT